MLRNLSILLVTLVVLIVTGVVHALWTERWGPPHRREVAAERLAALPTKLAGWDGHWTESDSEKYPQDVYGIGVDGRFVHAATGNVVTIYLTVGRPGPLTVHTPELCYGGGGFHRAGAEGRYTTPAEANAEPMECSHAVFSKTDGPVPQHVRVFWSWGAGGRWKAHATPRLALARYGMIYKLYLVRFLSTPDDSLEEDPILPFLRALMPELDKLVGGVT